MSKSVIAVKIYATVSTSNLLIQRLLTTVHSFLYEYIPFRTFRIAIKPNQNETTITKTDLWLTLLPSSVCKFDIITPPTNCHISM